MAASSLVTPLEDSNAKGNVAYAEDVERDGTAKVVDAANMERVELTEEDVHLVPASSERELPC
jgi:hypothetical protein